MPSNKPIYTYRTEKEVLQKLSFIAKKHYRTCNMELDKIVKDYIEAYELEHGEIVLKELS